jgi:deoxyribodipyrimidine photo-lyase
MPSLLRFRRDLRLRDHPALAAAAADSDGVLACFVLDPRLEASSGQRRLQLLSASLRHLDDDLDSRLLVTRGLPEDRIPQIVNEIGASSVRVAEDFAPFGRQRGERVGTALDSVPLPARVAVVRRFAAPKPHRTSGCSIRISRPRSSIPQAITSGAGCPS